MTEKKRQTKTNQKENQNKKQKQKRWPGSKRRTTIVELLVFVSDIWGGSRRGDDGPRKPQHCRNDAKKSQKKEKSKRYFEEEEDEQKLQKKDEYHEYIYIYV